MIKDRYAGRAAREYARGVGARGEGDSIATAEMERRSLVSGALDPKLFLVRTRPGQEREAVIRLLAKSYDRRRKPSSLSIFSAIAPDQLTGYIYVEAHQEVRLAARYRV